MSTGGLKMQGQLSKQVTILRSTGLALFYMFYKQLFTHVTSNHVHVLLVPHVSTDLRGISCITASCAYILVVYTCPCTFPCITAVHP